MKAVDTIDVSVSHPSLEEYVECNAYTRRRVSEYVDEIQTIS